MFIFRGALVEATCLALEPGSAASTWGAWGWWSTCFVLCFPICKMKMLRVFTSRGSYSAYKILSEAPDTYEVLSTDSVQTHPSFPEAGGCCLRDGDWVRVRVLSASQLQRLGMPFSSCDRKNETGMLAEHSEEGRKNQRNKQVTGEATPRLSVFKRSFLGAESHTSDLLTRQRRDWASPVTQ